MQLDKERYFILINKIMDIFMEIFDEDMSFLDKKVAIEHMGYFEIKYSYIPLEYDIVFENDRGVFSIMLYDKEGANNNLYRVEKFNNETTIENVKVALQKLKDVLKRNDFNFYFYKNDKLYRKNSAGIKRVKDLKELLNG